jgi:hypothetical protein
VHQEQKKFTIQKLPYDNDLHILGSLNLFNDLSNDKTCNLLLQHRLTVINHIAPTHFGELYGYAKKLVHAIQAAVYEVNSADERLAYTRPITKVEVIFLRYIYQKTCSKYLPFCNASPLSRYLLRLSAKNLHLSQGLALD